MADYSKLTNFASKDALLTGDPLKVIKGTELDDEFEAIETYIGTKADLASPTFTGTPKAPTAAATTNTTQLATTAFVKTVITSGGYVETDGIKDDAITAAKIADNAVGAAALNVADNGTSGQMLISDGDGSFSWTDAPAAAAASRIQTPAATDPTTRDGGGALQEGDIYYNTGDDLLNTYDGSAWNAVGGELGSIIGARGTLTTVATGGTSYTATQDGWYVASAQASASGVTVISASVGFPTQVLPTSSGLNVGGGYSESLSTGEYGGSVAVSGMGYLYSGESVSLTPSGISVQRFDPS